MIFLAKNEIGYACSTILAILFWQMTVFPLTLSLLQACCVGPKKPRFFLWTHRAGPHFYSIFWGPTALNRACGFKKWKIVEFLQLSAKTASKLRNLINSYRIFKIMAAKKVTTKTYRNIDEILDFASDEANPESDIEVDLGGGKSDDELESDWEYESEPNAIKQSKTIPPNVVMTEQSSASSVDPEYNDNNNDTYFDEDYVDSIDNNSITSSISHSDSSTTTDDERFSPQPKRQNTLQTLSGRP